MITPISLGIAIMGIIAVLMLAYRWHEADEERRLRRWRGKDEAVADLLNYASVVDDGIIVGKNGAFMAAWVYEGADTANSTEEQQEMVSLRINEALAPLGSGWMVHVDAVRRGAPKYSRREESVFPDPVSQAIDEERRQLFESMGTMYEGYFVLTITWFPPMLAERKFVELMFDDDSEKGDSKTQTKALLDQFKREIGGVESRLSGAVSLTRLGGQTMTTEEGQNITSDAFLSWLQFCVTGVEQPVLLPNNPSYLDSIIGGQEMWGGVIPKIGRRFIQVVSIEGYPLESTPGMLNALAQVPCEYRWSSRYMFMEQHEAVKQLDKFRKKWRQKIRGFMDQVFQTNRGPVDQDALSMVEDAEAALADVNSGLVSVGYLTSVVVLTSENRAEVEASARQVEKAVQHLGFVARVETINTQDAFMGSLPGHGVENVRRPMVNTMNLADMLPTSTIWTGQDKAPSPMYPVGAPALMHCVTEGATPFRLNLHVRDLGHTFMFGPTGGGKSTHLGVIVAQLRRYKGMRVYVFDKGMSMYTLTKAVGGQHFRVASDDDRLNFCPLQFLETKGDRSWAMEWIDTILALNGISTTPSQRNEIAHALGSMYQSGAKTLSEFSLTVQDETIREAIKQYTVDGAMGHLLDADSDGLSLTELTTFEIEELMDLGEKYALPVLLYLFRRIERSLDGQPSAIVLDEAWLMLGHEAFRDKIREWLKVMRKANCLVLMATQTLSDAANSGIFDVIVESTATKIFLPNPHAQNEESAAIYHRMGLNNRQIQRIAQAVPKRHYYVASEEGRRMYDLALGPLALAFTAVSDKEAVADVQMMEQKYGNDWVEAWLESKGLTLYDYLEAA